MFLTDLQIAARNLAKHTRRNLFLGGAIAAVVALLVLVSGLITGIRTAMLESATTLFTGHVNVGGFFKVTSGTGFPLVTDAEKVLAETRRIVPELDYAAMRVRGYGKLISEGGTLEIPLTGIDIASEPVFRRVVRLKEGSFDELAKPSTILLFEDQAKRLNVKVGDPLTLSSPTARGVANTAELRVAAVARSMGLLSSWAAFLPSDTMRQLYQLKPSATGVILVYLKDPAQSGNVAARLRTGLAAAGWQVMEADPQPYFMKFQKVNSEDWVGQKLDMTTYEDELSMFTFILNGLQALGVLLLVILLFIVIIGIVNTLAIAIRERTREIGTMRAIGMQRTQVLRLFLLEAALLGILGGVAGALLGAGVGAGLNVLRITVPESFQMFLLQQHLHLSIHAGPVVNYVILIVVLTTLAALYPALHAARLKPITAIHHIG